MDCASSLMRAMCALCCRPENILYSTPEAVAEPVIADFGLAKIVGKVEVHASLVGTPGYLSPEIITSRIYTPACDVWALGVILYILLCGYPPFYAEDNKALYEQIVAGAFEFHEDAWHEVCAWLVCLICVLWCCVLAVI